MNYRKHYENLIKRAQSRVLTAYTESHHIIPRCMGGTDESENLVNLTPEEHYVAHQLLVKIYPNNVGLICAAMLMTGHKNKQRAQNKVYGWLKRKYAKAAKARIGDKNNSYGKPWFHNPFTTENGKFYPGTEPDGWIKGRVAKKHRHCIACSEELTSNHAKWCNECRPSKKKVFKQDKVKKFYNREDKIHALLMFNGNIRKALYYLGLNDSGSHYKMMKDLRASVSLLPTK